MNDKKINIGASDIVLAVFGIIYFVGILTFFAPCAAKPDGSWMTCHWAGQAVAAFAATIAAVALTHLLAPSAGIKLGLSAALIPVALCAAVVPGNLIHLCGMKTMRCHTVMHPAVVVASLLVIAAAVADILIQRKKCNAKK